MFSFTQFAQEIGLFQSISKLSIYPAKRKYLRLAYQLTTYEYLLVPFGLCLAL